MYSVPALSLAASGKKLPSWAVTEAYASVCAEACGQTGDEAVTVACKLWDAATEEMRHLRKTQQQRRRTVGLHASLGITEVAPTYGDVDFNTVKDLKEYADALSKLKEEAGLTVRQLTGQSQVTTARVNENSAGKVLQLKRSTIYDVLNKNIKPSTEFTTLYLRACGLSGAQVNAWIEHLRFLHETHRRNTPAFRVLTDSKGTQLMQAAGDIDEHLQQAVDKVNVLALRPVSGAPR